MRKAAFRTMERSDQRYEYAIPVTSNLSTNNGGTVRSVDRAFSVLRAVVGAESRSRGISEIARETGLAKSTVARMLATLESLGMVERIGTRYGPGPGLGSLAPSSVSGQTLTEVARPVLTELVADIGEDAGLAVMDGTSVLYIDQAQADSAVQVRDWSGTRIPCHTAAAGFVLMLAWKPEQVEEYASRDLVASSPATATDLPGIKTHLDQAATQGYVWTHTEFAPDINGAAAPIYDAGARVVAAVNLYGPSYRFPGKGDEAEIGERLSAAGVRISRGLGYRS